MRLQRRRVLVGMVSSSDSRDCSTVMKNCVNRIGSVLAFFCLIATGNGQPLSSATNALAQGSPLSIVAITVEPASLGPRTLCRLSVRIENRGSHAASSYHFKVKIKGQEVTTYRRTYLMDRIDPGIAQEIRLFNFWTSDPAGPSSGIGGPLPVEVTLDEAQWCEVGKQGNVNEMKLTGAVEGLPVSKSLTLQVKGSL